MRLPSRAVSRRTALAQIGASAAACLGVSARAVLAQPASSSGRALPACVVRPEQTEGPFFVDQMLERSDIRPDPRSGDVRPGMPLRLSFDVSRASGTSCAPLSGVRVDVWHCDAEGRYSEASNRSGASGPQFLRGYQVTDAAGAARFLTIYPGWYSGRAVHIHFKLRTGVPASGASTATAQAIREFTSQIYFDDALNDRIYTAAPYAIRGDRAGQSGRPPRNANDFLFRDGGSALMVDARPDADGYAATFSIALRV